MTGRQILWHTFGTDSEAECVGTVMRELLDLLREEPPRLNVTGERLDHHDLPAALLHLEHGNLDGCLEEVRRACQSISASGRSGLLVSCRPDHPAAVAARRRLPHAMWGISLAGAVSLVYSPGNQHALWHEARHLLGAQDHYEVKTYERTCELPTCIM